MPSGTMTVISPMRLNARMWLSWVRLRPGAGRARTFPHRDRPLDDATYEKVREGGRIVSQAVVIAVGVREIGEKCILGVAAGASETEAFWLQFCRSLLTWGLQGVQQTVLDPAVGTSRVLIPLLKSGPDVEGFDTSPKPS